MTNFESMTMIERLTYVWNMPKDWSPSGGLLWFTVMSAMMVAGFFLFCWMERRSN